MLTRPSPTSPPASLLYTSLSAKCITPALAVVCSTDRPDQPLDNPQSLKTASADRRDLQTLARLLNETAACLAEHAGPSLVQSSLQAKPMVVDVDSSFRQRNNLAHEAPVSLGSFFAGMGSYLPATRADLVDMARALADQTLKHPLADFGGALSWSVPPSAEQQHAINTLVTHNTPDLPGFSYLGRPGALDYLLNVQPLTADELRDPEKALEKLLYSPQAHVLGNALRAQLAGIASDTSVADYVLAAIHVGLDPESIDASHRNTVANYDLADSSHWGKSAAEVINALSIYLEKQSRTTAGRGPFAARLLLARKAPQFLVKDIPPHVVYGSQAWANFSIAAATQEADAPGTLRNKTYAQVMSDADSSNTPPSEAAVLNALIDWAVCNGHLPANSDERYDNEAIARARTAFNLQQSAIRTASASLGDAMPSRKAMALAKLKEQFAQVPEEVFEKRELSIKDRMFNPGARSMLDIIMEGDTLPEGETWWSAKKDIPLNTFNTFSQHADSNITKDFNSALDSQKQLHQTLVKKLIADLPLADRENLEYGKIEFYKEGTYRIGLGLTGEPALTSRKNRLLIKVERNKHTHLYALDPEKGTLTKKHHFRELDSSRTASTLYRTDLFEPKDTTTLALQQVQTGNGFPKSFSSDRTQHIANVYVEALGLEQQARGVTSYDKERAQEEALSGFLLDLVPLRSAIVNFRDGHYAAGAVDLTLDIFGFITAGLGAGAKALNVLKNTGSAVSKLLKAGKILGATMLGELNPLSGTGDLLMGAGKLLTTGTSATRTGIQRLRGTAGSLDLIEAGKRFESAATGTFKVGEHTVEGSAVLLNAKWYAFDAHKMQAYGPALEGFSPYDTLMPKVLNPSGTRPHPYHPGSSSTATMEPLPQGNYVESTKGKLKWSHFVYDDVKKQTVQKFQREMHAHYAAISEKTKSLPSRPAIAEYPSPVTPEKLIADALNTSPGIVFGENHAETASFRLLFDKAHVFKQQGVKKVYLEGVIDFPGVGAVDDGLGLLGNTHKQRTDPTYVELVARLKDNGIEVVPLDHYYLTRHKGEHLPTATTGNGSERRLREFNYYASKVIQSDAGSEKWIALVGRSHTNTSEGVPGLAEQTGAVGIGIFSFKTPGTAPFGMRLKTKLPDPNKPIQPGENPGDLHILA